MTDIVDVEVFNKLLASVAEEMGIILTRSSYSPNIKERRDFSCAVFDAAGELVAQASHIPVHLGSMPRTIDRVLAEVSLRPGDIVITNDPYNGGSHLPDITLIEGVFIDGDEPAFYVANRAHHADIGGKNPGSMGLSSRIEEEGLLIKSRYYYYRGRESEEFITEFLNNVRNPAERQGDLEAQRASLARGKKRLQEMVRKYGRKKLLKVIARLKEYAAKLMRHTIAAIPDGTYDFTDYLDDDGVNTLPVPINVSITIRNDTACVDFCNSGPQLATPLNAAESVTISATTYAFQCLMGEGYPINQGSYLPISILTRPGSLLHATHPAPVAAGNVETSQRIVDVIFGALAKALPERIPAASCGSMNNVAIGGTVNRRTFTYYETIGGGMGARPGANGLHGIHTHMTNTMNTPVEALEHAYPFEIGRYSLRTHSGGRGAFTGGNGIIRSYLFSHSVHVSLLTERRRISPYGLHNGAPGKRGENILISRGKTTKLSGKVNFTADSGDCLIIKTPGGGGWGARTEK